MEQRRVPERLSRFEASPHGEDAVGVKVVVEHLWCHGTWYVRHARGWYVYGVRTVRGAQGKLLSASDTYSTQEAGTRSPYVQCGGPGTYV